MNSYIIKTKNDANTKHKLTAKYIITCLQKKNEKTIFAFSFLVTLTFALFSFHRRITSPYKISIKYELSTVSSRFAEIKV